VWKKKVTFTLKSVNLASIKEASTLIYINHSTILIATTRIVADKGFIRIPSTQVSVNLASIKQASTLIDLFCITTEIASTQIIGNISPIK